MWLQAWPYTFPACIAYWSLAYIRSLFHTLFSTVLRSWQHSRKYIPLIIQKRITFSITWVHFWTPLFFSTVEPRPDTSRCSYSFMVRRKLEKGSSIAHQRIWFPLNSQDLEYPDFTRFGAVSSMLFVWEIRPVLLTLLDCSRLWDCGCYWGSLHWRGCFGLSWSRSLPCSINLRSWSMETMSVVEEAALFICWFGGQLAFPFDDELLE